MDIKSTITTLLRDGLILVFNQDKLDVVKTAEALIKAGVNNMEVTCRIKRPLENWLTISVTLPHPGIMGILPVNFLKVSSLKLPAETK